MSDKSMVLQGDCLEVLKDFPDNSVDSLVTDPPAGISFMGKSWDEDKGGRKQWVAWMTEVMQECLRVLKPGAHGLVWAIPRTSHWTATALEDAGFEVRDVVTHIFGSGFPKSLDISKAIDKATGAEREVYYRPIAYPDSDCWGIPNKGGQDASDSNALFPVGDAEKGGFRKDSKPSTPEAKEWQGWGTALKPASERWILVRKPLSEKTVAKNVLEHGTGGINIDASRVTTAENDPNNRGNRGLGRSSGGHKTQYVGGDTDNQIKEYHQHQGRFPANLVLSHNDDCVDVFDDGSVSECTPGCAVAALDAQSGVLKSGALNGVAGKMGYHGAEGYIEQRESSSGGASRFFYCAKASKKDKGTDNIHPTVKSSTLMSYLIKLITPPKGVVLDPFTGSGSTGVSAIREGFTFIGIEKETEYFEIATKRIESVA